MPQTQRTLKKTKVLYSIIAVAAAIVYNFQGKICFGHNSGRFERNGWRAVPEGRPALGHDAERRMTILCGDDHLYLGGSRRSCDETSADNDTSSRPRTDLTGRLHPRAVLCAHGRGMRNPFPLSGGSSADFPSLDTNPRQRRNSLRLCLRFISGPSGET